MEVLKQELKVVSEAANGIKDIHVKVASAVGISVEYLLTMRQGKNPSSKRPTKKSFIMVQDCIDAYRFFANESARATGEDLNSIMSFIVWHRKEFPNGKVLESDAIKYINLKN